LPSPPGLAVGSEGSDARVAEELSLSLVDGQILLRDAEEPRALEQPTTIAGTYDTGLGGTGVISGATFSTPTLSIEQDITSPLVETAYIDASFTQVGAITGSITPEGAVLVNVDVRVDLHIEIGDPAFYWADCAATPVHLALQSTAPYDPDSGQVTLADPDFTIPTIPTTPDCNTQVSPTINAQLAGAGHALTMTLAGEIELPPPPGCPTVTTLAVDPATGSRLDDPVTLTATVIEDPAAAAVPECVEAEGAPAGFVDLYDGATLVETLALAADGTATLTTEDLLAGHRSLRASYRGQEPFSGSASPAVPYLVAAPPTITSTLPAFIEIGAAPVELQVTARNVDLGAGIERARLDLTLARTLGNGPSPLTGSPWNARSATPGWPCRSTGPGPSPGPSRSVTAAVPTWPPARTRSRPCASPWAGPSPPAPALSASPTP